MEEKLDYLLQHIDVIRQGMMFMLENGKNVLYNVQLILLASEPLVQCEEYPYLNQYIIEKSKVEDNIYIPKSAQLQTVFSYMMQFMGCANQESKGYQKILEYREYAMMSEKEIAS